MKKLANDTFELRVKIGDIENLDFIEYANLLYNYRITSVWSSPECLEHVKKIPSPITRQMDVYSFGMVLWELWHQAIPFDNEITQA